MLTVLKDMPAGVSGLCASGEISREDYDAVILPLLEQARRDGSRLRLLVHYRHDFDGVSPGGAWEGLRIGVHHLRRIERCAVLSDAEGVRLATRMKAVAGGLFSCAIKVFHDSEREAALSFLVAPEERAPMPHRLLPDKGVLVLEPQGPLREQDFEAVAAAVDPWIEAHGALRGLVVRASGFPGWQDVGGLMSHLRFVRDHHQKVQRVALVVDMPLADVGARLAAHFIAAELNHFPSSQFDAALAWAQGGTEQGARDTPRSTHAS